MCVSGIIGMRCAIWHHLYNLNNVKNTHRGVLLLVKLQASTLLKLTLLHGCLSHFSNYTNDIKSLKESQISSSCSESFNFAGLNFLTLLKIGLRRRCSTVIVERRLARVNLTKELF